MFEEETYTFQESESSPAISLIADRPSQQEFVLTIEAEDGGVSMSKLNITNAEFIPFKPELRNNNSMVINIAITNDDVAESNRSQLLKLRRRLQSPSFANCVGFLQTCSNTAIHISDDDREENNIKSMCIFSKKEFTICRHRVYTSRVLIFSF